MTIKADVEATARDTVRIPQNIMSLLRQSYDTREKVLDWCLAFGVAGALAWTFRDELTGLFQASTDVNAGRAEEPQPNQDVRGAFPAGQKAEPSLYTYNMPSSRAIRYSIGPSAAAVPGNPSQQPFFPE